MFKIKSIFQQLHRQSKRNIFQQISLKPQTWRNKYHLAKYTPVIPKHPNVKTITSRDSGLTKCSTKTINVSLFPIFIIIFIVFSQTAERPKPTFYTLG